MPCLGSSPLARGLPCPPARVRGPRRIIPARAGFTWTPPRWRRYAPDHPRSRGVYTPLILISVKFSGSSPLARGLRQGRQQYRRRPGIIPARAGFTAHAGLRRGQYPDHPRSRGVYIPGEASAAEATGSSPLARGLPARLDVLRSLGRIIPARAGFTGRGTRPPRTGRDHPRSRGVYSMRNRAKTPMAGSSPLARGLRHEARPDSREDRIIPARAGFTRHERPGRLLPSDHPRSRGVYASSSLADPVGTGSSPLARGLHLAILGIPTMPDPTRRLLPSLLT